MSMAYKYTSGDDTLDLYPGSGQSDTCIMAISDLNAESSIYIPNSDAPTVAAELLKASATDWSTQPVELVAIVASLERYAKANDPKVKLQDRRDAAKAELVKAMLNRTGPTDMAQVAIDRIIELEDGK